MNDLTDPLYEKIRGILIEARHIVARAINTTMVRAYFEIGRVIVEDELRGQNRAGYGENLLSNLSRRLNAEFGKGFSTTNLSNMKSFFLTFQNHQTLSDELSWSHYNLLMRLDNESARGFYIKEAASERWSVRDHYFIDLVFYNGLLQCFVLLDLKIGKLTHQDLGQMQMYVNFYDRKIKAPHENPTIGIVLCRDKKESTVKYTLPENNKQIFASKYKLYLPTENELAREIDTFAGWFEK